MNLVSHRFLSTLALAATVALSALNPVSATAQNYSGSLVSNPVFKQQPLPDFDITAITNDHTSGPAAQWRRGSCYNKVRVVVQNWGGDYQYGNPYNVNGKNYTAGQILISLHIKRGNRTIQTATQFHNALRHRGQINAVFGAKFPYSGNYTLQGDVFACQGGSSTSSCRRVLETRSNNNHETRNISVQQSC